MNPGSRAALDAVFDAAYGELLVLAHHQRVRWVGDHTLDTTALVHEAYLKLVEQKRSGAHSRAHFFALAATAMRHILCNYARERRAQKRGGDLVRVDLSGVYLPQAEPELSESGAERLLALDAALRRLEELQPRWARVVECRFFGGMTIADTAAALGTSPATVKRDWVVAQAWLHREINQSLWQNHA